MDKIKHNYLIRKKQKLEEIKLLLKHRFIGLDSIIDDVISLMLPWYLFPEAQLRPIVINLWGLTGSGKTALVQAIVELLEHSQLYARMDMGEFESDSASWIKETFTNDLGFFDQRPAIICLDEFQFARTLDANKNELGKDKLRVIWDLLDTGRINYIDSTYYIYRANNCIKRLEKAIKHNVIIKHGEVIAGLNEFIQIFDGFYFDERDRYNEAIGKDYFSSKDFMEGIITLPETVELSKEDVVTRVRSTASTTELKEFILEVSRMRAATKQHDLSNALIFVLGNLDEAYNMSHNMNPDISADDFYEATSRITIAGIKSALQKRFRPEQIARLGNNHIIYKSFNSEHFRLLIAQELERIANFIKTKFGWTMFFDESLCDVVYSEGVFPSQGTRPVYTTIKNLIESRISKIVVLMLEEDIDVEVIQWSYIESNFLYHIKSKDQATIKIITDPASLTLAKLRKSVEPEIQAHVALHEAGHAVLAALTLRIVPSLVVSRTVSHDYEGFCQVNFPKGPVTRDSLKKDIIITLGGYVAEKMIFGIDHTTSGVYADIEEASVLATKAIRKYAMGKNPIHIAVESPENEESFYHDREHASEALAIITASENEATEILQRNKLLLLKMAQYLTTHSMMDEELIKDYCIKYGVEEWLTTKGFIKKEHYYQFNKIISEQLSEISGTLPILSRIEDD